MATNVSLELYVASLGSINTENMVRKMFWSLIGVFCKHIL